MPIACRETEKGRRLSGLGRFTLPRTAIMYALVLALTVTAAPALAGVPAAEPSGCNTDATDGWYYSCWVSNNASDPDRISDFTWAIQTVLTYNHQPDDDPQGIDGYFGSNSEAGVEEFQTNHPPLTSDGIVGSQTWSTLQADIELHSQTTSYWFLNVEGSSTVYFRQSKSNGEWDVLKGLVWRAVDRTRS